MQEVEAPTFWKVPRVKIETIVTIVTVLLGTIAGYYNMKGLVSEDHRQITINAEAEARDYGDLKERLAAERARAIESEVKLQQAEEQLTKYIQSEMVPRTEADSKDKSLTERLDSFQRSLDRIQSYLMSGRRGGALP